MKGTFATYSSAPTLRKKAILPQRHSLYHRPNSHALEQEEGKLHFLCSLTLLMYQTLLNEVKLKKNYKVTTYLYQISLIDHQIALGTLKNIQTHTPRFYPRPKETKSCRVGLWVTFDDHLGWGTTALDTKRTNAMPIYRCFTFQATSHL